MSNHPGGRECEKRLAVKNLRRVLTVEEKLADVVMDE